MKPHVSITQTAQRHKTGVLNRWPKHQIWPPALGHPACRTFHGSTGSPIDCCPVHKIWWAGKYGAWSQHTWCGAPKPDPHMQDQVPASIGPWSMISTCRTGWKQCRVPGSRYWHTGLSGDWPVWIRPCRPNHGTQGPIPLTDQPCATHLTHRAKRLSITSLRDVTKKLKWLICCHKARTRKRTFQP